MQLFSTVLEIMNSLTEDGFIGLAIECCRQNPRPENAIPGIEWNGERNVRYGDERLWLEVMEHRSGNVIAVRFEKADGNGAVWDTDYVMNFAERRMAVRLDRSYLPSALTPGAGFSTPHFISMLIDRGYLKDDGDLPVSNAPEIIGENELCLLADVIRGSRRYGLPVVYVSKIALGEDPVDTGWMASRLKGIAHILVQEDPRLNGTLRRLTADANEYHGAVGVYFPDGTQKHRRFFYRAYEGRDEELMERVVECVIRYANAQIVDPLYTWDGVRNALLREKYDVKERERLAAEARTEKALDESNRLIESVDWEIADLKRQVARLAKANDALTAENQGLRIKLSGSGDIPALYCGEEEEFYRQEIREMILDAVAEALRNVPERTRRHDVLADILKKNGHERLSEKRAEQIKTLFTGYRTMSPLTRQALKDLGFVITEDGKHYKLTFYGDDRYVITLPKSGSDVRGGMNAAAQILRSVF